MRVGLCLTFVCKRCLPCSGNSRAYSLCHTSFFLWVCHRDQGSVLYAISVCVMKSEQTAAFLHGRAIVWLVRRYGRTGTGALDIEYFSFLCCSFGLLPVLPRSDAVRINSVVIVIIFFQLFSVNSNYYQSGISVSNKILSVSISSNGTLDLPLVFLIISKTSSKYVLSNNTAYMTASHAFFILLQFHSANVNECDQYPCGYFPSFAWPCIRTHRIC